MPAPPDSGGGGGGGGRYALPEWPPLLNWARPRAWEPGPDPQVAPSSPCPCPAIPGWVSPHFSWLGLILTLSCVLVARLGPATRLLRSGLALRLGPCCSLANPTLKILLAFPGSGGLKTSFKHLLKIHNSPESWRYIIHRNINHYIMRINT